eukprot:15250666-Heterocapsa_arctica.AAC.1
MDGSQKKSGMTKARTSIPRSTTSWSVPKAPTIGRNNGQAMEKEAKSLVKKNGRSPRRLLPRPEGQEAIDQRQGQRKGQRQACQEDMVSAGIARPTAAGAAIPSAR